MKSIREYRTILRRSLYSFIHRVFLTINPGIVFIPNWHLEAIAYYLTLVAEGRIKRLIITLPPRSGKSISASVAFVAWLLGLDPRAQIVCASYGQDLSELHAFHTRIVMESDWYKDLFPETRLNPKKCSLNDLNTTRGGFRYSTSVGGALTGRGGNIIILDDVHKAKDVESDVQRKSVLSWFSNTLLSRLNNKNDDAIIVIQQRLHEDDLVGHLLQTGDWVHLNLPAIAEKVEYVPTNEKNWKLREVGDLLHPERESQAVLDELKTQMGSYLFAAQYQQRPAPLEGGILKWDWFKTYDKAPGRIASDMVVQSWDPASSTGNDSDWSVCTTWLLRDKQCFLLDLQRIKVEFPELVKTATTSAYKWQPNLVIIENIGVGRAMYQQVRHNVGSVVRGFSPKSDKEARMIGESPAIEAGYVYVPEEAEWLADFHNEAINFPNGKHDDQVDSLSQFLYWRRAIRFPGKPFM
jgi:predicted phage terminase large subunit-like protein